MTYWSKVPLSNFVGTAAVTAIPALLLISLTLSGHAQYTSGLRSALFLLVGLATYHLLALSVWMVRLPFKIVARGKPKPDVGPLPAVWVTARDSPVVATPYIVWVACAGYVILSVFVQYASDLPDEPNQVAALLEAGATLVLWVSWNAWFLLIEVAMVTRSVEYDLLCERGEFPAAKSTLWDGSFRGAGAW